MSTRLIVEIVEAGATTAAVVVALYTSQRATNAQRRESAANGRRGVALDIAQWAQSAETMIRAYHDPENWRVPPAMTFGGKDGTGEIVPPSAGHIGPVIADAAKRFDEIKGSARLAFGPGHEVTSLVDEVIAAIQLLSKFGVVGERDRYGPTDYVKLTFQPLVGDLIEALADSSDLREPGKRVPRSGVKSSDHQPGQHKAG